MILRTNVQKAMETQAIIKCGEQERMKWEDERSSFIETVHRLHCKLRLAQKWLEGQKNALDDYQEVIKKLTRNDQHLERAKRPNAALDESLVSKDASQVTVSRVGSPRKLKLRRTHTHSKYLVAESQKLQKVVTIMAESSERCMPSCEVGYSSSESGLGNNTLESKIEKKCTMEKQKARPGFRINSGQEQDGRLRGRLPRNTGDEAYNYIQVVKSREKRATMPAYDCEECRKFYLAVGKALLNPSEFLDRCSRHRYNTNPYNTPESFWNLDILSLSPPAKDN